MKKKLPKKKINAQKKRDVKYVGPQEKKPDIRLTAFDFALGLFAEGAKSKYIK